MYCKKTLTDNIITSDAANKYENEGIVFSLEDEGQLFRG